MSDYAPLERPMIPAIVVSFTCKESNVESFNWGRGGAKFVCNINFTCFLGTKFHV